MQRPTIRRSHTYSYDAEGRVLQVDGGTTNIYVYNSRGMRAALAGAENLFDLNGNIVSVVTPGTATLAYNRYTVGGRLLATNSGNTTDFYHQDWLGGIRALSSLSGSLINSCTNLPFGDGTNNCGLWYFAGLMSDPWDTLNTSATRSQSPTSGRWLTPDPAGLAVMDPTNPQTWNRYAYVTNNPVSFTDPTGLGDPGGAPAGPWSSAPGGGSIGFYGGGFSCTVDGLACGGNGGLGFLGRNGTALLPSGLSVVTPIDGGGFAFPTVAADGSISYTFSFDATYKGVPLTNAGLAETLGLPTGSVLGWLMGPAPNNGGQPQKPLLTSVPTPPNPVLKYANCSAAARSQAEDAEFAGTVMNAGGSSAVGTGCLGTGPLAPECALTLFVIDVFNEGLLYGVKRYSIWDGEGKCLQ